MNPSEKLLLIYDGDCPVCRYYCEGLTTEKEAGELERIDFRRDDCWENYALPDGASPLNGGVKVSFNPDQAILFRRGGQIYQGGEALYQLNRVSRHRARFQLCFKGLFFHKWIACACYPVLRLTRNLLLKMMKKKQKN